MGFKFLRKPLFLIVFIVPNLISIIYFGLVASPVYTSTASLLVLNPSQNASSVVSLLSGNSSDGSAEGAYVLEEYVNSWEEFSKIEGPLNLAKNFGRGDLISRFGGLATYFRTDDVGLWHYYQSNIKVSVDPKSGIVLLGVNSYGPDFSVAIATALLSDAVRHMDKMNQDQEADYIENAESKQAALEQTVQNDELSLDNYRARIGIFDPQELYTSDLSLLNSLALKDADLKSEYDAISKATPNNPETENLLAAMAATKHSIAMTTRDFPVIAQDSVSYESLVVNRDNDIALLQQASLAVQEAQLKAIQNRYYLNIISEPSQPQTPELPRRLNWIGGIFLATFILWGLLR